MARDESSRLWRWVAGAIALVGAGLGVALAVALLASVPANAQEPPTTGSITIVLDASPNDTQDFTFTGCKGTDCGPFTLDDDTDPTRSDSVTAPSLAPGTYTITQSAVPHWALTSLTCTGGGTTDLASRRATIALTAGESTTCTFTDTSASISIRQDSSPDDGHDFAFTGCLGTGCGNFALDDDTDGTLPDRTTAAGLAPGTYVITQAADADWALTSITCTTTETRSVANRRVTITLTAGEQTTCTFGDRAPSLTIVQATTPDDAQDFDYTGCLGSGCAGFTLDDDNDATHPSTQQAPVVAAGTYTVTQATGPAVWPLTSIYCNTGETVSLANRRATITLAKGEQTTCTFTNSFDDTPGTLALVEDTAPDGPQDVTLHRCTAGDCVDLVLDDDHDPDHPATTGAVLLAPGTYTVSADAVAGYELASIACTNAESVDLEARQVTIRLDPGKSQGCTLLHRSTNQPTLSDVAEVDAGTVSSCARLTSGEARCWGYQYQTGQLGDGTFNDASTPQPVLAPDGAGTLSGVADMSTGFSHSCAALGSGEARCWGYGQYGQLGDGTTGRSQENPVVVSNPDGTGALDAVSQVAAGGNHSCGLLDGGQVRCWGHNANGELGDGTTTMRARPVVVTDSTGNAPLGGVTQISARLNHTCSRSLDGGASCWGANGYGMLGDGSTTDRARAVTVLDGGGTRALTGTTQISAGFTHTCAVLDTTEAQCWGRNASGQLGDGSTTDRTLPVTVLDADGSGPLAGIVQIAAGGEQTCALVDDGTVYCWGKGANGALGDGTTTTRSLPAPVLDPAGVGPMTGVAAISSGVGHSCALLDNGQVRCWGANGYGRLGDGTSMDRRLPAPVVDPFAALTPLTAVADVTAGPNHSCSRATDGRARCWGSNEYGQLGNPDVGLSGAPVPVQNPSGDGELLHVAQLTAGSAHTCARTDGGGAVCWGSNRSGRLGDGTTSDRGVPVPVAKPDGTGPLTGVVELTAGDAHTCAVLDGGRAVCWGFNGSGQLGDGTTTTRLLPVFVTNADGTGDLTGVVHISGGSDHTCAVTADAEVRCWGPRPVVVTDPSGSGPLTGVVAVDAGADATCALLDSTEVRCWGENSSGQLGDGTTTDRPLPVPVVGVGGAGVLNGVTSIAVGEYDTCATLSDGQARCWGDNILGMLGDGSRTNSTRPVVVSGLYAGSNLADAGRIAVGSMHTCVVLDDGQARCWGRNDNGRVGDGTVMGSTGLFARLRPRVVMSPLAP